MAAENKDDMVVDEKEVVEEEIETESEEDIDADLEDDDDDDREKKPLEPWEEELEEKPVTVNAQIKQRRKFQKREEVFKTENETLKAEIERLKTSGSENKNTIPDEDDFDTREEYKEAEAKYIQNLIQSQTQTSNQKEEAEKYNRNIEKAVGDHYDRVDTFVKDNGIKQEVYDNSDANVRQIIEDVIPGQGDSIYENLVSKMGDGSEKVTYFIGRNKAEFQSKLMADKTGIEAAIYIGRKLEQFNGNTTKKRQSKAPAPASSATGDVSANAISVKEKSLKKQYEAAHKAGDGSKALDIKMDARRVHKINTNYW